MSDPVTTISVKLPVNVRNQLRKKLGEDGLSISGFLSAHVYSYLRSKPEGYGGEPNGNLDTTAPPISYSLETLDKLPDSIQKELSYYRNQKSFALDQKVRNLGLKIVELEKRYGEVASEICEIKTYEDGVLNELILSVCMGQEHDVYDPDGRLSAITVKHGLSCILVDDDEYNED